LLPLLVLHHPGQHFVTHELAKQFCLANFFISMQICTEKFLQSIVPQTTFNSDAGPVLAGRNKPIAAGGNRLYGKFGFEIYLDNVTEEFRMWRMISMKKKMLFVFCLFLTTAVFAQEKSNDSLERYR
jgi:hypothetical protein